MSEDLILFNRAGNFTPLADDVVQSLSEEQRAFYKEVGEAVDQLNAVVAQRDNAAGTVERWVKQRNAALAELRGRPKKTQQDLINELKRSHA